MDDARVVRLVDAQARARRRAEANLLTVVYRLVAGMLGSWYDPAAQRRFTDDMQTAVSGAQRIVGGSTAEMLQSVLREMGEPEPRQRFVMPTKIRDVPPEQEWARPAEQFRYAKSQGASDVEAQQVAKDRAEILALDDTQLAQNKATVALLKAYPKVEGYRRVIHPELSAGGTCGLCAVAADRVYKVDRLMPVHARCKCGVLPITMQWDPGSPLNEGDLRKLYDAAGSTSGDLLKRVRFKVEEHSELGPQLLAA
jgi:hypothetical protein